VKIEKALEVARKQRLRYILIHPGVYKNENLAIDFDVKIIGLAREDSQYFYLDESYFSFNSPDKLKMVTYLDSVQIVNENESTLKFNRFTESDNARAYLGYCSISVCIVWFLEFAKFLIGCFRSFSFCRSWRIARAALLKFVEAHRQLLNIVIFGLLAQVSALILLEIYDLMFLV